MNEFETIAIFEFTSDAQILKAKLESEGIEVYLKDEHTLDADPLISNALGGVKLQVPSEKASKAFEIYKEVRDYERDAEGNLKACPSCSEERLLVAETTPTNIFFMLFPFFERKKYQCVECGHITK